MKLLHCFAQKDKSIKYMVGADYCIYCNKDADYLYNTLSEIGKDTIRAINYHDGNMHFKEYEEILNKFTSCQNGITEEEYIIKSIIE